MREMTITVPPEFDGATALSVLRRNGFSHRMITKLKASGGITRCGEILRTIDAVHAGDAIRIVIGSGEGVQGAAPSLIEPNAELRAEILYEDEDCIVFDKPPFMPIHPSIRHRSDTLANVFAAKSPSLPFRPVYRLDCNTSGLCLCAKNQLAASALAKSAEKVYFAVTDSPPPESGTLTFPIDREGDSIIRRCVAPTGKPAVTHYTTAAVHNGRALLRISLETGRTHQIRVHFAHIGCPLMGDELYGGTCTEINRHALHCGIITFTQPVSGERIQVISPLPEDMAALMGGIDLSV